uniref:aromatic-ring hydroxylase C-terminal domain-containing protein n=1 Tax=Sphingomonas sp. TaxID=28214 RepID=UPI0035BBF630
RPTLIVSAPEAMVDEAGAKDSLSDLDGAAHAAYGLEGTPALVLVRPDGHIAFRGSASRTDLLQRYCEKTFAHPAKAA